MAKNSKNEPHTHINIYNYSTKYITHDGWNSMCE